MGEEEKRGEAPAGRGADPALERLRQLDEQTMLFAWGPDRSAEERRRIVAAALIFGRKFEEGMAENPPESLDDARFGRFLMGLMNAAIAEFAASEGLDDADAAAFMSDVGTRDAIFEFSDTLDRAAEDPDTSLDEHLRATIGERQEKAIWSHHWLGGHRG